PLPPATCSCSGARPAWPTTAFPRCIRGPHPRSAGSRPAVSTSPCVSRASMVEPRDNTTASGVVIGEDGVARPPWASVDPLRSEYYDTEWGVPVRDERGTYERVSLDALQAGLAWAPPCRKRHASRAAFE